MCKILRTVTLSSIQMFVTVVNLFKIQTSEPCLGRLWFKGSGRGFGNTDFLKALQMIVMSSHQVVLKLPGSYVPQERSINSTDIN